MLIAADERRNERQLRSILREKFDFISWLRRSESSVSLDAAHAFMKNKCEGKKEFVMECKWTSESHYSLWNDAINGQH